MRPQWLASRSCCAGTLIGPCHAPRLLAPPQVSVNDIVIKAAALALAEVPAANSLWDAAQEAAAPAGSGGQPMCARAAAAPMCPDSCSPCCYCLHCSGRSGCCCCRGLERHARCPHLLSILQSAPTPQWTLRWLWPRRAASSRPSCAAPTPRHWPRSRLRWVDLESLASQLLAVGCSAV